MNEKEYDLKILICPVCKIPEETLDMHEREDCTLMIYKRSAPDIRSSDGFEIFPILCFKCKNVTEIAINPLKKDLYQYGNTREVTKADIGAAYVETSLFKLDILKKKLAIIDQ